MLSVYNRPLTSNSKLNLMPGGKKYKYQISIPVASQPSSNISISSSSSPSDATKGMEPYGAATEKSGGAVQGSTRVKSAVHLQVWQSFVKRAPLARPVRNRKGHLNVASGEQLGSRALFCGHFGHTNPAPPFVRDRENCKGGRAGGRTLTFTTEVGFPARSRAG